jgi:hypothetical protein
MVNAYLILDMLRGLSSAITFSLRDDRLVVQAALPHRDGSRSPSREPLFVFEGVALEDVERLATKTGLHKRRNTRAEDRAGAHRWFE